ncbi:MAG: DUF1854 domain-containing protein [Oscillospiraceae bacterium]|nr:DUF1854 domain-containing protein [Oscillospiraceae bacterium]
MSTKPNTIEQDEEIAKQQAKVEELLTVRYLTPDNAAFVRTDGGFVSLEIVGASNMRPKPDAEEADCKEEKYDRVNFFRAFPFSDPDRYVSVREADTKAREIGIIQEMNAFSEDVQTMLREQMNLRYFTPTITRVFDVKVEYGYAYWDVMTDRGPCKFTMNSGSIPHLSDVRLLISDIDGNRFEIKDFTKLPQKDVKKLDLFL